MDTKEIIVFNIDTDYNEEKMLKATSEGIELYNINNEEIIMDTTLKSHTDPVVKAIFFGKDIVSVDFGGKFIYWKFDGSYSVLFEKNLGSTVNTMCGNEVEKIILIGMADGRIKKLFLGEEIEENEVFAHTCGISAMDCNKKYLVTGGMDNLVFIWDLNLRKIGEKSYHDDFVRDVSICNIIFDFFTFASCGNDGKLIIYDKDFQVIDLEEPCYSLDWTKSGYCLSVSYGENKYKAFVPGDDGKFVEAELTPLE